MKQIFILLIFLLLATPWQFAEAQTGSLCSDSDIDLNDNGLIDICDLERLNAIRYQPDGTGYRASSETSITTVGCPPSGCNGYELRNNLDFEDERSYRNPEANKADWTVSDYNDSLDHGWLPIGTSTEPFNSKFEGNGYKISNLTINRPSEDYASLFGVVTRDSNIRSISLFDANVVGEDQVGSLVGKSAGDVTNIRAESTRVKGNDNIGGLVGINQGTIRESFVSGRVEGTSSVGGLAGRQDLFIGVGPVLIVSVASIVNSTASSTVFAQRDSAGGLVGFNFGSIDGSHAGSDVEGSNIVGGLVGTLQSENISLQGLTYFINNSSASGNVEGNKVIGGLVGYNQGVAINNSHASGDVTGTEDIGGLVGFLSQVNDRVFGTINNSYASGNVMGNENVGGLVGRENNPNNRQSISITITGSYATGDVVGDEDIGGLVGLSIGSITNSYATGNVQGNTNVGGLVGSKTGNIITGSHASGNVQGRQAAMLSANIGGLVGWNTYGDISDSYASGDVTGDRRVGGLIGLSNGLLFGTMRLGFITSSYASGNVSGNQNVGGLIGRTFGSDVSNSYASGNVEGDENIGGLVGYNGNAMDPFPVDSSIADSYASGTVRGSQNAGGLIGYSENDDITNSYWNRTNNPTRRSAGGTSKTLVELQSALEPGKTSDAVYYMWGLDRWDFGTSKQYPVLKSSDGFLLSGQRVGLIDLSVLGDSILSQAFNPSVFSYRVVSNIQITQIQLIPIAANSSANIIIRSAGFSERVVSGTMSSVIPLNANAATAITIEVSAKNDQPIEYRLVANNTTFVEGERIMLDGSTNRSAGENSDFLWTQISGISLLPEAGISQAILDVEIPDFFIAGDTTTRDEVILRLDVEDSGTVVSKEIPLTIVKADNGVAQLTSDIVLQNTTLMPPEIDLSSDADGGGLLDMNSYQWQLRATGSGHWTDIANAVNYDVPEGTAFYNEYRMQISYIDGQGYTWTLTSEVFIFVPDIDIDDNGLIEINDLEGLNAIRYQSDGSGYRASNETSKTTVGCLASGCKGYELTRNLDFNLDESYRYADLSRAMWTTGLGWQPIGTLDAPFNSIFDANNHTISNLRINRPFVKESSGLFATTGNDAEIRSVGLLATDVVGRNDVGGLIGNKRGGIVSDSYVVGYVAGGGGYNLGGLVGWHQGGEIIRSHSNSTVMGSDASNNVGGLVGEHDEGTITGSYALGRVAGNEKVGGLVGKSDNGGIINRSYATAGVNGDGAVGGLVGENGGVIINSYTEGRATGRGDIGGLVGENRRGTIVNSYAVTSVQGNSGVGGFVGYNFRGTIMNSYALGEVSGMDSYIGGFVGWNGVGTIINGYARGDVSGQEYVGGFAGVNLGEFGNPSIGVIDKSYAVGNVRGISNVGGLVGDNRNQGMITNSYWDKTNNSASVSDGGTSKTTVEMQVPGQPGSNSTEIYYQWSTDDWDFTVSNDYPLLKHATGSSDIESACGASDDLPQCSMLLSGQGQFRIYVHIRVFLEGALE